MFSIGEERDNQEKGIWMGMCSNCVRYFFDNLGERDNGEEEEIVEGRVGRDRVGQDILPCSINITGPIEKKNSIFFVHNI